MKSAVHLVLLLAALTGCSGRDHTNPFDEKNPATQGRPDAAWALAGCERVELGWDDLSLTDIVGFSIARTDLESPSGGLVQLTADWLAADVRTYVDATAHNGRRYSYTVNFHFAAGSAGALAAVAARAGAALPWTSDPDGWGLTLLTPDGLARRTEVGQGYGILDLAVDPARGWLFAAEIDSGQVILMATTDGTRVGSLPVPGASALDFCPALDALAVVAFYEQTLTWVETSGAVLGEISLGEYPEDVAFRDSLTTWVAFESGALRRASLGVDSLVTAAADLERAVRIADDPAGGGCWVADRNGGQVAYVCDDLTVVKSASGLIAEPRGLAIVDSTCWVADRGGQKLIRLDRRCEELERIEGLGPVQDVAVEPQDDGAILWAVLPESRTVLRIAPDGRIDRVTVAGYPRRIVGDWEGGCP